MKKLSLFIVTLGVMAATADVGAVAAPAPDLAIVAEPGAEREAALLSAALSKHDEWTLLERQRIEQGAGSTSTKRGRSSNANGRASAAKRILNTRRTPRPAPTRGSKASADRPANEPMMR